MGRSPLVVSMVWLVACGGGGHDYLSDPPEEAAQDLAEHGCDAAFDCGVYEISCSDPPTAHRVSADTIWESSEACQAETAPYYVEMLTGCAAAHLTAAQQNDFNDCLSISACMTPPDLSAYADAICNGGTIPGLPEACQRAQAVFALCSLCGDDPTDPQCGG